MKLTIGTRGSALALAQATGIANQLKKRYPDVDINLEIIKTAGDKILDAPLSAIGDKGLFVKELETALMEGSIDLAVHSVKDLPAVLPDDLTLAAFPPREDPADVLVTHESISWMNLPQNAVIGTGSLRRQAQLLFHRPDLTVKLLRGNVDTRLKKLDAGDYFGIVIAKAGMNRLGIQRGFPLPFDVFLPSPGQGALALEIRKADQRVATLISPLNHTPTEICVKAERSFLKTMEGGCSVPLGGLAMLDGTRLCLQGMLAAADGSWLIREQQAGNPEEAEKIGHTLAHMILEKENGRRIQ